MEARFFCYVLRRPDQTPFYVGFGNYLRVSRAGFMRNAGVNEIVSGLRALGLDPVRTVEEFPTVSEAKARELELINLWGRRVDGGILENLRIGDRGGVQGRKISREQVAKMQSARSPHTDEFKNKMSARLVGNKYRQGYVYSDEERRLRSEQTRAGIARKRAERSL